MRRKQKPKKIVSKIRGKLEKQVVELSLKNPDFGARRLNSLLKQENIITSPSTVYTILKRHGLQTRDKRYAKLNDRPQKKKSPPRKPSAKIPDQVTERIIAISLQNPDFGARRLSSFLKTKGIDVAVSTVYSILKRNKLNTFELRLAKGDEQPAKEPELAPRKEDTPITASVEERVVEVSFQHPDYSARHLVAVLAEEGISISSSAVYTLLKHHGLQTRSLRHSIIETQHLTETFPQVVEPPRPYAVPIPRPAREPKPVPREVIERAPVLPEPTVSGKLQKTKIRNPWFLTFLNVFLFVLLGFLGFYAVRTVHTARVKPEPVIVVKPAPLMAAEKPATVFQPLNDYRTIWDRNLFNISKEKPPAPEKKISLDEIALAKKELGLRLVGTVVANDTTLSRAIVHNQKTREQNAYSEGDEVDEVTVKKILRNKVVITTDKGDQLLIVAPEDFGKRQTSRPPQQHASRSFQYQRQTSGSDSSPSLTTASTVPRVRSSSIRLERDEIEASLADIDTLMQQVRISPYRRGDQSSGFRISSIPAKSALRKMGLRSRDVILGINGEDIKGPEQAAEFFGKISEGGEISIKLKRRRRTRQINLNIE